MKCQLLMTGNELMTGVTIDTNSTWMAEKLLALGINVSKKVTVGDRLEDLTREIQDAASHHDLLIINGGLGPTVDDLTAQALSKAFDLPLYLHPDAESHVLQWCERRGIQANAANLKQALLPRGTGIIPNSSGSAVGIELIQKNCLILCTPGVPTEMKQMFDDEITPQLLKRFNSCSHAHIKRLQIFGMGESSIQQKVHNEIPDWPPHVELGFRAGFPTLEVKLTVHDPRQIPERDHCENRLRQLLGSVIFGEDQASLASVVLNILRERGLHITFAESCTGGLLASTLTALPGASQVFDAGFVTYSNIMKQHLLGVDADTLSQHGAVSEAVVLQMLEGALDKSAADYGIAVSGIAGPEGGTAEKPVGTVWIAWGKKAQIKTRCFCYPSERKMFQTLVTAYGLDLIRRELLGMTEQPRYFR